MYKLESLGFCALMTSADIEEIMDLEWVAGAARREGKNKLNLFIKSPEYLQWELQGYMSVVRSV